MSPFCLYPKRRQNQNGDKSNLISCVDLDFFQKRRHTHGACRTLDVSPFWIGRRFGCIQIGDTPKRRQIQNGDTSKRRATCTVLVCRRLECVAVLVVSKKRRHAKTATNQSKLATRQNGDMHAFWISWIVAVLVCRRFGGRRFRLSPFWSVAALDCRRFGFVAVLVLSPF